MITITQPTGNTSFLLYKTSVKTFSRLVLENELTGNQTELAFEVLELANSHKVTFEVSVLADHKGSNQLFVYDFENNLIYQEGFFNDFR